MRLYRVVLEFVVEASDLKEAGYVAQAESEMIYRSIVKSVTKIEEWK